MEEVRVCRGNAAPAQCVEKSRELAGCIEPLGGEIIPAFFFENPAIDPMIPEHL